MFLQGHSFFPAMGKAPEAKRLLADHVRQLQSQGQRILLSERIYSSEGPQLLTSHLAPELADLERIRQARLVDEDFQTRVGQWLPLLRQSPPASLWEGVTLAPPDSTPTSIIEYVVIFPGMGHERRMVAILSEMVGELRQTGERVSLWRQIYSAEGPRLMVTGRYADLADLDRARHAREEIVGRAVASAIGLARAPAEGRLTETIVALPLA